MSTATMREVGLISLTDIATGPDSKPRSWVMLLPEGKFSHHTYGEIDLSRKALDEMARNFHDKVRGIELALDYDHKAAEGDSRAPGWLEDVEYRAALGDTPAGLWGKVRWTSIGLDDVRDERYRYISAEFKPTYKDELSGRNYHNVLIGATLTNRPFMKQMPAIALSQRSKKGFQSPGHYTKADRAKIKHFAGPNESYPIEVPKDVEDAAGLIGMSTDKAEIKANIIRIAHDMGPEFVARLPKEWTDKSTAASESAARVGRRSVGKREQVVLDDQFDPEDAVDDADEEDFEETESDESEDEAEEEDGDDVELADRASAKGKSSKSKAAQDDEEDQADDSADESDEGEAMDDGMDSEEYAEENPDDAEDEVPVPAPRKMGKSAKGSKKMSEETEAVRLREENATLLAEVQKYRVEKRVRQLGSALKLAESAIEEDEGEVSEQRTALSRTLRQQYAKFLGSTKLAESQIDDVQKLLETAIKLGVVDLSSMANKVDLDDRREQPKRKANAVPGVAETERAKAIALSEHKRPLQELPLELMESIYERAYAETNR